MNLKKARRLLRMDIAVLSLEQLQKYNVDLIDAWRYAKGDYGNRNDFFVYVPEIRAYIPTDKWLQVNLETRMGEVDARLQKYYREE